MRLGTTNPRERASAMYDAAHWVLPTRPTVLDQPSVAPGQDGSFTFFVHAPEVNAVTVTDEYFAPVADVPTSTSSFMYRQGRTWSFSSTTTQSGVFAGHPATFSYVFRGNVHGLNAAGKARLAWGW